MSERDPKKPQRRRKQVAPEGHTEDLELESNSAMNRHEMNNEAAAGSLKFDTVAKMALHGISAKSQSNALKIIANVKSAGNKWVEYTTQRRLHRKAGLTRAATAGLLGGDEEDEPKMSGIGLAEVHDDFVTDYIVRSQSSSNLNIRMVMDSNRALIQHFAEMADSPHEVAKINLDFVDSLLKNGANINIRDKTGQSLLHEVARAWHVDVARWLLEHGIDINQADDFGRTALHVAAAVDCVEIINLLIDMGAAKECVTKDENQTPVFYAAKSDATNSLKVLIKRGCKYKMIRDYKGRTPIHVAAELDRSETARLLLELNAPIGVSDNQGQKAITWMITKMAPVANEALNQFRSIDRHNRAQYFYLNLLVQDRKLDPRGHSQTPLQVAVAFRQYDLLLHPTVRRLQHIMWVKFTRFWAIWNLGINFVYILLWTLIGILVEYDKRHIYSFPDDAYRVVLWIVAVAATVWQIVEEIKEFYRSKRNHRNWEKWRETSIEEDMKFCHPRWPEEQEYLQTELTALEDLQPKYFRDAWNIFDWLCYIMLLVDVFTHIADVVSHSESLARAHIRVMCVTIILLWLRLMKNARAFALLGPFIVMLGHMMKDCVRFLFLYMEFYIPFMAAFWMLYGGTKKSESDSSEEVVVDGYEFPAQLIFSLLRLTLVDDYDYANMKKIDEVFTDIILIAWFLLSSILCVNLFIALLSDTFQRVYDNAQANSVMQKAITILSIWDGISAKRKQQFFDYIESSCSPLKEYYDDDLTQSGEEDLKKVTFQIKDKLEDFAEHFKLHFGDSTPSSLLLDLDPKKSTGRGPGGGGGGDNGRPGGGGNGGGGRGFGGGGSNMLVSTEKFENEVSVLHEGLRELQTRQEDFMATYRRDMEGLQAMLKEMTTTLRPDTRGSDGTLAIATQPQDSMDTPVSKLKKKKKRKTNPFDMPMSVETLDPVSGSYGGSIPHPPSSQC
ncbi:uncharacterized protein LOC143295453 isoform X2 [Babylonia areolata]|uniref:uncharacterized protein LOC143295453 isoform X2 n=1 Tax=Babylonia areolata TaxID=304850 RepID=UPI003FD3AFAB